MSLYPYVHNCRFIVAVVVWRQVPVLQLKMALTHYVAQTDLEIAAIFLCQSCKCWDYRHMDPHPAVHVSLFWVPCPFCCYVSSVTVSPFSWLCGYFSAWDPCLWLHAYCCLMVILVHSLILQIFIKHLPLPWTVATRGIQNRFLFSESLQA